MARNQDLARTMSSKTLRAKHPESKMALDRINEQDPNRRIAQRSKSNSETSKTNNQTNKQITQQTTNTLKKTNIQTISQPTKQTNKNKHTSNTQTNKSRAIDGINEGFVFKESFFQQLRETAIFHYPVKKDCVSLETLEIRK